MESLSQATGTLGLGQGGTGGTSRISALNSLAYLGINPISDITTDTPSNWLALGSGYFSTNAINLNNQPAAYTIGYQLVFGNDVVQILSVSGTGNNYVRKGNAAGWWGNSANTGTWKMFSDSSIPMPVFKADSSSTGIAYTITNSILPNTLTNGYTFKFSPNATSTSQSATLAINGGTAYPFTKMDTYAGTSTAVSSINAPVSFLQTGKVYTLEFISNYWKIIEEPIINLTAPTGTLPIANGGTNGTSRQVGMQNLSFLGSNPTTSSTDTLSYWQSVGPCFALYSATSSIQGQPTSSGMLVNYTPTGVTSNVFQIWIDTSNSGASKGQMWRRSASSAQDISANWYKILDSNGVGVDYAAAHPVGAVITNTSSSASGYPTGTWSNIGSATIGSTTIYYWKRTA